MGMQMGWEMGDGMGVHPLNRALWGSVEKNADVEHTAPYAAEYLVHKELLWKGARCWGKAFVFLWADCAYPSVTSLCLFNACIFLHIVLCVSVCRQG